MRRAVVIVALAACGTPPPFTLKFDLTQTDGNTCATSGGAIAQTCSDVTTSCAATVSIKVLDPNQATAPYISVCQQLTGKPDLCAIAGVSLPPPVQPIDEQQLEVQMAVYPTAALCKDANGDPICPSDVQFTTTGFPESSLAECTTPDGMPDPCMCPPTPAVGGRAYYYPGDSETVVDLGCPDLTLLDSCTGQDIMVTAVVDDFDTEVSVSQSIADELTVSVGEPTSMGSDYVLDPINAPELTLTGTQPPVWSGEIDPSPAFSDVVCLEVVEDVLSATALTCQLYVPGGTLDITGVRLAKATLDEVLGVLTLSDVPDAGLVIGIVLDDLGTPASGYTVTSSEPTATVNYLSSDRMNLIAGGTSSSGIFVSEDTPFRQMTGADVGAISTFTTSGARPAIGYGGLVEFKVTIVVLQLSPPPD